jgi:hypothetical protein
MHLGIERLGEGVGDAVVVKVVESPFLQVAEGGLHRPEWLGKLIRNACLRNKIFALSLFLRFHVIDLVQPFLQVVCGRQQRKAVQPTRDGQVLLIVQVGGTLGQVHGSQIDSECPSLKTLR